MTAVLNVIASLEDAGECPACGVRFAMPSNLLRTLRDNCKTFYCPNGHEQSFRESETTRLKRDLEQAKQRATQAEELARRRLADVDRLSKTKQQIQGKLRAIKLRAANGVCPCCQRSFVQLARHMRSKHPAWVEEQQKTEDGAP